MARCFPSTLDGVAATPGEARLFERLSRLLPGEDHWLWFRPLLESPGRRRRRPPFVLLGPGYGLLVLGVADGTTAHPEREARDGADALRRRLEDAGASGPPVAWGVLCPEMRAGDLRAGREAGVAPPAPRAVTAEDLAGAAGFDAVLRRVARVREGGEGVHLDATLREWVRMAVEPQLHFWDLRVRSAAQSSKRTQTPNPLTEPPPPARSAAHPSGKIQTPNPLTEPPLPLQSGSPPGEAETVRPARLGGESSGTDVPPAGLGLPATVRSAGWASGSSGTTAPLTGLTGLAGHWLDRKQERMARELASPRTLVYGPAGSGKTIFLVSRAQYWLGRRPEARVLFTCYNASLASHLRSVFETRGLPPDGERLTVRHYHDLCGAILGVPDIHERSPDFYAALEPRVLAELARNEDLPLYDLILVDEGQDMTRRMMEVLVRLNAPGGEITVVSDPAQDIYGRWSEDTLAPLRGLEVERLVDCYRNTAPIFSLALAVLDPEVRRAMGLGRLELTRPEDLGRLGPPPELPALGGLEDLPALIGDLAREFRARGRPLSDLAVLYPDRHAIPRFAERVRGSHWQAAADPRFAEVPEEPRRESAVGTLHPRSDRDDLPFSEQPHFAEALERELRARDVPAEWVARDFASKAAYDITKSRLTLSTIHSAKGMDFHTVVLLGAETLAAGRGHDGRRAQSLLFTGITRARERLVIPYFEDAGWVPELRRRVEEPE